MLWLLDSNLSLSTSYVHSRRPSDHSHWQIYYSNTANRRTRLLHHGQHGINCDYNQTFRQVVYAALHDQEVKRLFMDSRFNSDYLALDTPNPMELSRWFVRVPQTNRPITNLLTVVEFVMELRGMPVPCDTLDAMW
jgi:hypothetical protein